MIQLFDTGEPILAQRSTVNRYIHCWNRQPGATISATARRYRPQQKTISAIRKINIGHNHIGHKIYGMFIWCHRDDTSRFRVVCMVNLNVKEAYVYMFPLVQ